MNYQYTIKGIKNQNDLQEFQNLLQKVPSLGVIKSITIDNVVFNATQPIDTKSLNLNFAGTPYTLESGQVLDNVFDEDAAEKLGYDCE